MHPQTLRKYERLGLVQPTRTIGSMRLYSRDELSEWVAPIRHAASEAKDTHILMNNCYANYGTTNARELAALLSGELSD